MKIRKFIQLIHHEVFTTGLADDGTIWRHDGANVWEYEGEAPQFKKPEIRKYYIGNGEDECIKQF